jgi:pimeloyl-ACP methyl ester carboxylesterase
MPNGKRIAALGGAAAVAIGAAAWWWDRQDAGDPWDPDAPRYPAGEERRVTTDDGVELAVTTAGAADGPTVVLSHCWTGSRAIWGPVAERLCAAGCRVVLYDQRGHGQSTHGDEPPTIAMLGHDLRAVLDALDVHDAVLVGHSMGGMSVQSYAAEHPVDFKERVRAVVLVATAAQTVGRALPAAAIDRLLGDRYPAWAGRGALGRALVRGSIGQTPQRAHVELTLDGWARTTGYARAGFLTAMASMDLRTSLRDAGVPATILVGTRDRLTPVALARRLASGIPDSELVVLPGAGHMLPLERPDDVVEAIEALSA